MISVIDYGLGNVQAFKSAYDHLGIDNQIIKLPEDLKNPTHIILPGVGSFDEALKRIEKVGFKEILDDLVLNKKVNILGVCVGLQMMCNSSEEGKLSGFGWIDAKIKKIISNQSIKLPHIGWNKLNIKKNCPLLKDIQNNEEFYFLHSYSIYEELNFITSSTTTYGSEVIASISYENIYGTQFHPEKSHDLGLKILKNFYSI